MALIAWFEAHENLAGWAQFFGAMLALLLTYFTAFAPMWRRKKQLRMAAARLLSNAYEVVESYHRTSAHFLPTSLSLKFAAMTMIGVASEIERFPVYELDDQGSQSLARNLVAVAGTLRGLELYLGALDPRPGEATLSVEDRDMMRTFLAERLALFRDLFSGKKLTRPQWPAEDSTGGT